MADDDRFDNGDQVSDEDAPVRPDADWDEVDPDTGFSRLEQTVYTELMNDVANRPEDEREDVDEWAENFADSRGLDVRRVKAVTQLGIYSGERNEFNERHGKGHACYPNGDEYRGQFHATLRQGNGTYVHGKGTYTPSAFEQSLRQAWAELPEPRDAGSFSQDMAIELRTSADLIYDMVQLATAADSDMRPCYSGEWLRGQPHGQGVWQSRDGTLTRGHFRGGKRHGHCIVLYPNGDRYVGEFVGGRRHGHGAYIYSMWVWAQAGPAAEAAAASRAGAKSGGQLSGQWREGRLASGRWVMADGVVFQGGFDAKCRPEGNGALGFPSSGLMLPGKIQRGRWAPEWPLRPADFSLAV
eukprot:TRINITY_DN1736_c0_g2_i1.p1 TRINITY_DN1736_c0_g2~~TRINITY_DN1736_c0_g2_i1.p1  ORF type:complete len:355 (+),score=42.87 TRINITY_DN1736_c0_g2_i1:101-1165(+)